MKTPAIVRRSTPRCRTAASPNGGVQFILSSGAQGHLEYTVTFHSKNFIDPSPVGIAAHPADILANPSVDVLNSIPTPWDETVVLPFSEIRQIAGFARRSGDTRFLAIANGPTARNVRVNLSAFLAGGSPQ